MVSPIVSVVERPDLVWSAGAPVPVFVRSETRTLVAFEHPDGQARVAEFVRCVAVSFGFPNDEALQGHPLWDMSLAFYQRTRSPARLGSPSCAGSSRFTWRPHRGPFPSARHFVLTFHGSTLEAIADDVLVIGRHTTISEAVADMSLQVSS